MLKPQLWIGEGTFTGYIEMKNEEDWKSWEKNYRSFILNFAELAAEEEVEVYCIGTELAITVAQRVQFWKDLIKDIRMIYKGKLTYAENWDSFDQPAFLGDLDFIGVDAYFPLSEQKEPTKTELQQGWQQHLEKMKQSSEKHQLPVLFTEWGYRNIDYSAQKPWDYSEGDKQQNDGLQSLLYEVAFETVFSQPYLAGGFLWKWHPNYSKQNVAGDTQFSPQHKPAEQTLKRLFRKGKE